MIKNLKHGYGRDFTQQINQMKGQLAADKSLLVDGSNGPAGPYDKVSDTIADACRASKGWKELDFLYTLTLTHRPSIVLELGTNIGISSAYIAAALKATGDQGWVHTVDTSPYRIKTARHLHESLKLDNVDYTVGLFYDVLPEILNGIERVDMAFIDGQHALKPTLYFFEEITRVANHGGLIVFGDINFSEEKANAWRKIRTDPKVFASSEVGEFGLVILGDCHEKS